VAGETREYDATPAATISNVVFSGVVGSDDVAYDYATTVTYADKSAGTNRAITTHTNLTGTTAAYYVLSNAPTVTGTITPKTLTVTGLSVTARDYDQTTNAPVTGTASLVGVISGDTVNLSGTVSGAYGSAAAGTNKTVTLGGLSLGGGDAANYELDLAAGLTGDVNRKAVTIATLDADDKVFDGTAAATVTNVSLSGVLAGDNVSLSTSGATIAFADENVGTSKTVTATGLALTGSEAANYILSGAVPAMTADISRKALTITGLAITPKEYDGNNTATLGGVPVLSGMVSGATVLLNDSGVAASFADKDIGTGKPVAVSGYTLDNGSTLAANYILSQPTGITGDITAKTLTITGATVADRAYDGTTDAPVSGGSLSGVILSEDVQLRALAASYGDANVGNAKPVVNTGFSLTGTDIGNYALTQPALTGRVTAKNAYVIGVTAVSRVYDRTTNASLNGTALLTGLVSGEVLTLDTNAATAGFADWEVGTSKPVTVAGYAVTGATAANYTVVQPSLTADITPKLLPLSGLTNVAKEYDGTTAIALTNVTSLTGVIPPDDVQLAGTAVGQFVDANVGTNKVLTVTGASLTGTNAPNYLLDTNLPVTGSITRKRLVLSGITPQNKFYDGTKTANLSGGVLSGIVAGEDVRLSANPTAEFDNENVGTNKPVTVALDPGIRTMSTGGGAGVTLTGSNAANYLVIQPSGLNGTINPAPITVSNLAVVTREYAGSNVVTATLDTNNAALVGVVAGDNVGIDTNNSVVEFQDGTVGANKAITITSLVLNGADAAKYTLTAPTGLLGEITAKALDVTGVTVSNKVYDGTTTASLGGSPALGAGVIGSDSVQLDGSAATANFATAGVANAKAVTVAGYFVTGADAGNYTIRQPTNLTADITAKTLTLTGLSATNKIYDGGTNVPVTGGVLSGVVGADDVQLGGSAAGATADANVGTNKAVALSGLSLAGGDAANYTVSSAAGITIDIDPKPLTVASGLSAANKPYDGTRTANLSGTPVLSGVVGSDVVDIDPLSTATALFADASAGANKIVAVTGYTLTGAQSGNYTLTLPVNLQADISPVTLTVTGLTVNSKVYNKSDAATLGGSGSLVGVVGSDIVNLDMSGVVARFADDQAGTGKVVTVSGLALGGSGAGNYTLTQPAGLTGDITAKAITVTADALTKTYGDPDPALTQQVTNGALETGDSFTGALTRVTGETVGTYAIQQGTFTAGANYNITFVSKDLTIGTKNLTVAGATAQNKSYDNTTAAVISGATLVGKVGTDDVALANDTAGTFSQATPGTGLAVTTAMTLTGTTASNYTLSQPAGLTADITKMALTITADPQTKVYGDPDPTFTYQITTGALATGDSLTGTLDRVTGNNVGTYAIGLGTLAATANYTITLVPDDLTITAKPLTVTADPVGKIYGQNDPALTYQMTSGTLEAGDSLTGSLTRVSGEDVGVYSIQQGTVTAGANYAITFVPDDLSITAKGLTVTGASVTNKEYDRTTTAAITGATLSGVEISDAGLVALAGDTLGTFAQRQVGTGIAVTTAMTLAGAKAGNYSLTQPSGLTGDITAKALTVTGTAATKVYDGLPSAVLTGATLTGVIAPDAVTLGNATSGTCAASTVGSGLAVTTSFTLLGADKDNYTVTQPSVTGDITAKRLTITGATVTTKPYDGNRTATVSGGTLVGVVGSDDVNLDASAAAGLFADKNAGAGKAVTVTGYAITGTDIGNYTLTQPATTGDIQPLALNVTGAVAQDKTYDGTDAAVVTGATLDVSGVVAGETVTLANAAAGTFAQTAAGTGIGVTTAMTLAGADAGNYSVIQPTGLAANITGKALTITGAVATNRVYDGSVIIGVGGGTLVGVATNDVVTLVDANAAGTVASKVVGTNKAVTVTGYLLGGADAGNYTVNQPTGLTANITKLGLTVTSAVAQDKNYNGTAAALITGGSLVGVISGDVVNLAGGGVFSSATIGTNKTVTATFTLTGADAGNYSVTQPTGLTASINRGPLQAVDDNLTIPSNYAAYTSQTVSRPSILWNDGQGLGNPTFAILSTANGNTVTPRGNVLTVSRAGGLVPGEAFRYTLTEDTDGDGSIDPAVEVTTGVVTFTAGTTTAGTLKMLDSRVIGGNFTIIFSAMPGTKWQLQKTASLSSPLWVDVGTPVTADANGYVSFSDPIGSAGSGFYEAYRVP
jgi:hypothetical protein